MRKWLALLWLASSAAFGQVHDCTNGCTLVTDVFPPGTFPDSCRLYNNGIPVVTSPVAPLGAGVICLFTPTFAQGANVSLFATSLLGSEESTEHSNVVIFTSSNVALAPPAPINTQVTQDSGGGNTMTIAFRSLSSTGAVGPSATPSATITPPAGIQDTDELLILLYLQDDDGSPDPVVTAQDPTGFSLLSGFPVEIDGASSGLKRFAYVWKKTASSESGNYVVNFNGSSARWFSEGLMLAYSTDGPVDVAVSPIAIGSTTTATANSITTTKNNSMIMYAQINFADVFNRPTVPTGTTPTFAQTYYNFTNIAAASGVLATAGATGTKSEDSLVSGAGSQWAAFLISIAPTTWSGPTTNLTHRWPLDAANSGNDVVGAMNGTVTNATQTMGPSGAANTAYHLDSPGGYVDIGATPPISFTGAWSVGYWVDFDSLDSYAADGDPSPIDFDDGAGHSWRSTFSDTNTSAPNQYISESGTPNIWVHSGLALTTGAWYQKTVTFDGTSTYKVYLNGVLLSSVTDASGNGTSANNIFGGRAATARLVHGAMAQVVTYSKELTAGEVTTLYAADSPGGAMAFFAPQSRIVRQALNRSYTY